MPSPRGNKVSCSNYQCEIELTMEVLRGKWKALIIWNLHLHEVLRYNELRRLLPNVTQKMLSQQLRELEDHGIVHRKVYPTVPPMVEYSLTPGGLELIPIMSAMDAWGKKFVNQFQQAHDDMTDLIRE